MNKRLFSFAFGIFLVILLAVPLVTASSAYALQAGEKAPELGLTKDAQQKQFAGKVVLVDFWASWCGPCKKSFPWMMELQNKYSQNGFTVVTINLDQNKQDALKFLETEKVSGVDVYFDPEGKSPEAFGVETMPSSFLIDRSGNIAAVFKGFHGSEQAQMEKLIEAAIAEERK